MSNARFLSSMTSTKYSWPESVLSVSESALLGNGVWLLSARSIRSLYATLMQDMYDLKMKHQSGNSVASPLNTSGFPKVLVSTIPKPEELAAFALEFLGTSSTVLMEIARALSACILRICSS